MTEPPFDQIDAARIDRHERLMEVANELWHDVSASEIVLDIGILLQLAAFRTHQALVLSTARLQHAQGGTHDCGQWWGLDGRCAVCGAERS